jgi:UDP-N-acetylglucosamine 4-epimerase
LDNLSTGNWSNLREVQSLVTPEQWNRFSFIEGDIENYTDCDRACNGIDYVLHQAALASVPRSLESPLSFHTSNVSGTVNLLEAARKHNVRRLVYASSSAVYGDSNGELLSPYAATKHITEIYARTYHTCYGLSTIGLRYFNVYGPRQDPAGAYAAVIPKWINAVIRNEPIYINGDGETTRDFCYVQDVVQANVLAAITELQKPDTSYNVGYGESITLNSLLSTIQDLTGTKVRPLFNPERPGDIRHSLADISRLSLHYGYKPQYSLRSGLGLTYPWYRNRAGVCPTGKGSLDV